MQRSSQASQLLDVYERELDEIVRRRREAGLPVEGKDPESRRKVADDLVGLALSGGGVRSASFNLGLIQAVYETGMLKEIDYLSTVSGGGYVGACLSSAALKPETQFEWQQPGAGETEPQESGKSAIKQPDAKDAGDSQRGFELAVMPDGRQSKRVNELIHSGTSLRRPLLFLNRYLIGVVLTNLVVLSGLFALCALAAILFRSTDYTVAMNWLYALGFRGDVMRAFFPATFFLALWLILWAISYWRKGVEATGRIARIFLALTIVSFLMAIAMVVGTGDVSLAYFRDNWGIEPPKGTVESISRDLQKLFLIGLVIALLPYLRVRDLIRSGAHPRNVFEGWIFAIATRAMLYGLPLLVFGFFAREDISGYNARRMGERHGVAISYRADVGPLDFNDWRGTWREIELQSSAVDGEGESAAVELYAVGRKMWELAGANNARESIQVVDDMAKFDANYGPLQRWLLLGGQLVTGESNPLTEQYRRREKYYDLRRTIGKSLTDGLLCSQKTYKLFQNAGNDFRGADPARVEELDRKLKALTAKGELLEFRIGQLEKDHKVTFQQWVSTDPIPFGLEEFPMEVREQYARTEEELKDANWEMLLAYLGPQQLNPKSTIFADTVLVHDQETRLIWFLGSLAVFLVSGFLVNLNATSLHGYYRNGIAKVWIDPVPGFGEAIPLTSLDTTSRGAPYHLINATVHLMGSRIDLDQPATDAFLFSRGFCGSKRTGFAPTDEYCGGRYDLPNATAVSGAAVTPSQAHNPLLALLLFISNSRLGQWLPNPGHKNQLSDTVTTKLRLPFSPIRLLIGLFQPAELRNHCFVADGGHHENLGLEALLERRVRTIIVSDVTCDPEYQFEDLVRLHRRMAAQLGIRIEGLSEPEHFLDLSSLVPDKTTRYARSHVFCARINYPRLESLGEYGEPLSGLLIYLKPGLTGDESLDLRSHQEHCPTFPHDSTADQFYDPDRFESYRQLGYHLGQEVSKIYKEVARFPETPTVARTDRVNTDRSLPELDRSGEAAENPASGAATSANGQRAQSDLVFLVDRLNHEDPEFQCLAVHAIGERLPALEPASARAAVAALADVLFQPDADKLLLEKAVWALGEAGSRLEPEMQRILAFVEGHEGDVRIRAAALELLKDLIPRHPELKQRLEKIYANASPLLRNKAAILLNGERAD